jgi:hypothetical protein
MMYSYFVTVCFDIHNAQSGDYAKAHAALTELGLERAVPGIKGSTFHLTNTTAVGDARGNSESDATTAVKDQVVSRFRLKGLQYFKVVVTSGSRSSLVGVDYPVPVAQRRYG